MGIVGHHKHLDNSTKVPRGEPLHSRVPREEPPAMGGSIHLCAPHGNVFDQLFTELRPQDPAGQAPLPSRLILRNEGSDLRIRRSWD
jgi:hypothetical protein